MIQLKNGQTTTTPMLDRIYELDWRSLNYTVGRAMVDETGTKYYRPRSYTWSVDEFLDQGYEGACVGFSFCHELAARPVEVQGLTNEYARQVYFAAQRIDPWAGGAYPGATPFYEGTSVLAGAKILTDSGFYESYSWALSVEEVVQGLGYFGPCVLGINWYEGMFDPDEHGFLHPTGNIAGGHAILAHAVRIKYKNPWAGWWGRTWRDVDLQKSYIVLHNSWGKGWGEGGRAKLSLLDLDTLLKQQGDACFPKRTAKLAA